MSNSIKVSIIVPVYNVPEDYLKKCVNSLINQTLKEIEIILVDDGTPETSGKICDELSMKDKRIKVVHQENKGLCGARNSGVRASSGKWITFVDGDDWIENNAYESLYNKVEKNNADLGFFGYVKDYPIFSVNSNISKYFKDNKIYETKDDMKYLLSMVLNYNSNFSTVNTKFIKREFLIKNNIFHDEELRQGAEGIEFNIRLFQKTKRVVFINKDFYHYIYNSNSITNVHNENNHKLVVKCFEKIEKEIFSENQDVIDLFYNRVKYVILTTAISGYFNPKNGEKYSIQKKKFKKFMENKMLKCALNNENNTGISFIRKITLFFIKYKLYFLVKIVAFVRYKQKNG